MLISIVRVEKQSFEFKWLAGSCKNMTNSAFNLVGAEVETELGNTT